MPAAAVAARQPVKAERTVPGIHSVQGINSTVEDIVLRGQPMIARIGPVIVEATLVRKILGASELTLTVLDPAPKRQLLRSALLEEAHEISLDGLPWRLVKVSSEGINEPLVLTYEPLVVYLLKHLKGPHKSFRDNMTRAEFAEARAFEADPRPRFIAPELHVVQDIASSSAGKEAQKEAEKTRGKGVGKHVDLKVNSHPATKAQADILDRMLRQGESMGANTKVMESMVMACIDESNVGTLSSNLMQEEPFTNPNDNNSSPEDSARGYLEGWNGGVGAIEYNRAHPTATPAEIATNVQANRDGAAPYERFSAEGKAWVAAYGGGAEVSTIDFKKYAFQQTVKESNWHCMVRLATEVKWRCFESASWIYFLDDPTLLRSHRRMQVSDIAPGIIDVSFDYDVGKEVTEVTVEALAKVWAAPPGSVAGVERCGPADGVYLVEQIESHPSSRKGLVQVTLRKEVAPLPEPSPKASTSSTSFAGGAHGAPAPVQAMIAAIEKVDAAHPPYSHAGHGSTFAPLGSTTDCSGFISQVVHAAGYLNAPLTSAQFAGVFPSGEGEWVTIYGDTEHVVMKIKYPDGNWRWAATSSSNPSGGPGWIPDSLGEEEARIRGNACHPKGL
jgi:hypothetical protein